MILGLSSRLCARYDKFVPITKDHSKMRLYFPYNDQGISVNCSVVASSVESKSVVDVSSVLPYTVYENVMRKTTHFTRQVQLNILQCITHDCRSFALRIIVIVSLGG